MQIKKGQSCYLLPNAVCEIRNAMWKNPRGIFYAIHQVPAGELRALLTDYHGKPAPERFKNQIFIALELDEIGGKLLVFPVPDINYRMELQVMQVINL